MSTETYYLTTAIDYVNSRPHIGTAYEKIGADCLARYMRLTGRDTHFLMGNDEHSVNVARAAESSGLDPKDYCDRMEVEFRRTWEMLHISFDDFVRTTEERHRLGVLEVFRRLQEGGFVYKGTYSGLYCESCEEFLQEKDLVDGLCPNHRVPPRRIEEENYFFALSRFQKPLEEVLEKHPEFVRPTIRRNEILGVLRQGLEDISISRTGRPWGIPLPGDPDHVIYVWFDALINYISALGFGGSDSSVYDRYWPADCHIIGKDITRFHCLIWPAMLLGAEIPLPRTIWAHGFVTVEGMKMSKTIGNVREPGEMVKLFGPDGFRYLMLREVAFDRDGDFTLDVFVNRYNADLANDLGNLLSRTLTMVNRYLEGSVPEVAAAENEGDGEIDRLLEEVPRGYREAMEDFAFHDGLARVWELVSRSNRYIEENRPWDLARDPASRGRLELVLGRLLRVLRVVSAMVWPALPEKALEMRAQLGLPTDGEPSGCGVPFLLDAELEAGTGAWERVGSPAALFPRIAAPDSGD
jgi:methionyl-tRNA synthetase